MSPHPDVKSIASPISLLYSLIQSPLVVVQRSPRTAVRLFHGTGCDPAPLGANSAGYDVVQRRICRGAGFSRVSARSTVTQQLKNFLPITVLHRFSAESAMQGISRQLQHLSAHSSQLKPATVRFTGRSPMARVSPTARASSPACHCTRPVLPAASYPKNTGTKCDPSHASRPPTAHHCIGAIR